MLGRVALVADEDHGHNSVSTQGDGFLDGNSQGVVQGILGVLGNTAGNAQDQATLTTVNISSCLSPAGTADDGISACIDHCLGNCANILQSGNGAVKQAHIQSGNDSLAIFLEDSSHSNFFAAHNTHCIYAPFMY